MAGYVPKEGDFAAPMVEQVKSVDFRSRQARRLDAAPPEVLDEILAILDACMY